VLKKVLTRAASFAIIVHVNNGWKKFAVIPSEYP
jgi:hypothetical protein